MTDPIIDKFNASVREIVQRRTGWAENDVVNCVGDVRDLFRHGMTAEQAATQRLLQEPVYDTPSIRWVVEEIDRLRAAIAAHRAEVTKRWPDGEECDQALWAVLGE